MLAQVLAQKDYASAVTEGRRLAASGLAAWKEPALREWAARRFRNLFISQAVKDAAALSAASVKGLFGGVDKRPDRQKISERFLRLDGPAEWLDDMPDAQDPDLPSTTLLFCPGLLTGLLPVMAFQEAFPALEQKYHIRVLQSDSHPMRGCEANVADIAAAMDGGLGLDAHAKIIPPEAATPPGDVIAVCYSKGMPDLLTTLVARPDLAKRIKCIFNWAGAPGGSSLADNIYNTIKGADLSMAGSIVEALKVVSPVVKLDDKLRRLEEYHIKDAIQSLTTGFRQEFLDRHREELEALPFPVFNITGSTTVMEVPYFQMQGVMELNKYDANNDMQVTQNQAKLRTQHSVDLAMMHGHHWDLSYSPFPQNMRFGAAHLDHPFPKEAAVTAMLQLACELGIAR
jgi:hypothetical protein